MASLQATLVVGNGASGTMVPNQPISCTLTLTNPTASAITISGTPVPFATSNSQPSPSVVFGQMSSVGNQLGGGAGAATAATVPAASSVTYSFGLVMYGPQGSAETGTAQANCATTAIVVGVNVVTTDGNSISPRVTLTPSQMGAVVPSAAATGPGQFLFNDPSNSPNYLFW